MTLSDNNAILLALLLSYAGWGTLSMSMARHLNDTLAITATTATLPTTSTTSTTSTTPTQLARLPRLMRMAATGVLLLSTMPLAMVWGAPIGVVAWCGVLSVTCLLLACQLHYAARSLRLTVGLAAFAAVSIVLTCCLDGSQP